MFSLYSHIPPMQGIHKNMKCCGVCRPAHPWLAYLGLARAKRFFAWRISIGCSCHKFGASVDVSCGVAVNCDFNCGFNCGSKTFSSCKLWAARQGARSVLYICYIYIYLACIRVRACVCFVEGIKTIILILNRRKWNSLLARLGENVNVFCAKIKKLLNFCQANQIFAAGVGIHTAYMEGESGVGGRGNVAEAFVRRAEKGLKSF